MKKPVLRYYVHGDESEIERGRYYCRNCDAFLPLEHFQTPCCGESHGSIYIRDRERFRAARELAHLVRPERPHHVIDRMVI
jgi:hypothetical protein